jgi:hypothetical protein
MTGIEMIAAERKQQIEELKFTVEKDVEKRNNGELLRFANYLISADSDYFPKGFHPDYVNQFFMKPRIKQLTIAGAFIAAEIDRLIVVQNQLKDENNGTK